MKQSIFFLTTLSLTLLACGNNFEAKKAKLEQEETVTDRLTQAQKTLSLIPANPLLPLTRPLNTYTLRANLQLPLVKKQGLRPTSVTNAQHLVFITYTSDTTFSSALDIISVLNPQQPKLLKTLTTSQYRFNDFKIKGQTGYIAASENPGKSTLLVLDLTRLDAPEVVNQVDFTGSSLKSLDLSDDVLTATNQNLGYHKLKITYPLFPVLITSLWKTNSEWGRLRDEYNLTFAGQNLKLEAGVNPPNETTFTNASDTSFMSMHGSWLLAAHYDGSNMWLKSLSISQNLNLPLNQISLNFKPLGLASADQLVYVSSSSGIEVVDAQDLKQLKVMGKIPLMGSEKVWLVELNSVNKILVISTKEDGLKIIEATEEASIEEKEIVFFASTKGLTPAKLEVRVNDAVVETKTLSSTTQKMSTFYHRQLTASDKIEVVFKNAGVSEGVYIGFLKVNQDYCYLSPLGNGADLYMSKNLHTLALQNGQCKTYEAAPLTGGCIPGTDLLPYQACVSGNMQGKMVCGSDAETYECQSTNVCLSGFYFDGLSCQPQNCSPGVSSSCNQTNGSGTKVCLLDGSSFSACTLSACDSGYVLQGGNCLPQNCTPGSQASCQENNLQGQTTCDSSGLGWSSCDTSQSSSCNPGFFFSGGSCLAQVCAPNSSASCAVSNGSGVKICDSIGSAYGVCVAVSCGVGFHQESGSCVANTRSCAVANGLGEEVFINGAWGACIAISCSAALHPEGGACVANQRSCSVAHGSGEQLFNGSNWDVCQVQGCDGGYHEENNSCVSDQKSCLAANGQGSQVWLGNNWSTCEAISCDSGFSLNNGFCQAQSCTPNATVSCSLTNGQGQRTCDALGQGYGACQVVSCNGSYHQEGGACVNDFKTCTVSGGTGTSSWNASLQTYNACEATSCDNDHYLSGTSCVPYCPNPLLVHAVVLGLHVCL